MLPYLDYFEVGESTLVKQLLIQISVLRYLCVHWKPDSGIHERLELKSI